jgi:hypothetical protein
MNVIYFCYRKTNTPERAGGREEPPEEGREGSCNTKIDLPDQTLPPLFPADFVSSFISMDNCSSASPWIVIFREISSKERHHMVKKSLHMTFEGGS